MPVPQQGEPNLPYRPPWGIRVLGGVLLTCSVGLVSCQAMFAL
jgi:hypothetical protein|nr:hypothetical protein [Thiocapsa sp.]